MVSEAEPSRRFRRRGRLPQAPASSWPKPKTWNEHKPCHNHIARRPWATAHYLPTSEPRSNNPLPEPEGIFDPGV
jgi:hypothetical protein